MSFETKANQLVAQATKIAASVTNWADFANLVFGRKDSLVATAFTDEAERQLFYDSTQYKAVSSLRARLIKQFGVTKGGNPEKSGKILLRLPKSLHRAIDVEAKKEGTSVNQLIVSKLSVPLKRRSDLSLVAIVEAFSRVHDGYSADRVVVDSERNAPFLAECRKLGLEQSDYALNHALLDIRKSKKMDLPDTTKRTEFRDYDEYQFAAEIAIRIMQRSEGASLDQILCDPALSFKFDDIARQMAPKVPALKLRCAALNLRKTRRLGPKILEANEIDLVEAGPFWLLNASDMPQTAGVYSIFDQNRPLFAGETENLEQRLMRHREGTMPKWLGIEQDMGCVVKYSALMKAKDRGDWLAHFINAERPMLNWQKVA